MPIGLIFVRIFCAFFSILKKTRRKIKNKDQKPAMMLRAGTGAIRGITYVHFIFIVQPSATSSFKDVAPAVGTACFHCGGHGFAPWSEN